MPTAIYASRIERHERSRRPRRTVRPLADLLGLEVDHRFGHDGERRLAAAVADAAGPVLVCWHHEGIPALARLIAVGATVPSSWPDDRFDVVWVLDRDGGGEWKLSQIPQLLLAGDRPTVV